MLSAAIAGAQAPANDDFANRQTISPGLTTTDISAATIQAGEPYATVGYTVWYTYTPAADTIITLDTTGTAFKQSFVAVYIGNDINNLTHIESGYSGNFSSSTLKFSFKAKSGTTYQICAGSTWTGSGGGSPLLKLTLFTTPFTHVGPLYSQVPSADGYVNNDRFENRTVIAGSQLSAINYLYYSTTEAGEPYVNNGRTVWYSYTSASDAIITLDTTGTVLSEHFVSVYMGNSINNLIAIDDRYSGNFSSTPFKLSFYAKAGTTYQICAGSVASLRGSGNLFQFTLTTTPFSHLGTLYGPAVPTAPTPVNDSFYTPQSVSGNLFTVIGSNLSATLEAGESGYANSLWYRWTPTADKFVRVDLDQNNSPGFGVSTGATLQTTANVTKLPTSPTNTFEFNAKAGVTYNLLVASPNGAGNGQFQFSLTASTPPKNDAPVAKFTSPKGGNTVSTKGFYMTTKLSDKNGISAFQIKVNGKLVINKSLPYSGKLFSGKVKKGTVTLQIRAQDTLGLWGPYQTITVKAK